MSDGPLRIRIVAVPGGEAPFWVREAWVGLILYPCYSPRTHVAQGILTGVDSVLTPGFSIYQRDAVDLLQKHAPAAAAWWRSNLSEGRMAHNMFVFEAGCGQPVPDDDGDAANLPIVEWDPPT